VRARPLGIDPRVGYPDRVPIVGVNSKQVTVDTGTFWCPHCWDESDYELRVTANFVFVLFIPFHSKSDEVLICRTCDTTFGTSVRSLEDPARVSEFRERYRATMEVALTAIASTLRDAAELRERAATLRSELLRDAPAGPDGGYRDDDTALAATHKLAEGMAIAEALGSVRAAELPEHSRREIAAAAHELATMNGGLDFESNEVLCDLLQALGLPDDVLTA